MNAFPVKIQRLLDDNYEFRFGDYISRGFSLIGQNIGGFVGFFILSSLISLLLSAIPIIGPLASLIIGPALSIGPYIVANKLDRNEPSEFSDFFGGFSRLWPLVLTSLLTGLIIIACMLPGILLFFFNIGISALVETTPLSETTSIFTLLLTFLLIFLPAAYLGVSYIFAPLFVWFYHMEPWPAMEASRKIVGKQWWLVLAFLFVSGLIAAAGVIALFVGLLYTIPAMTLALYASFADVTRLDEEDADEPDVIDHFMPSGG